MASRFAIAIGIKKSGKLTPLLGAPNDARRFAKWAKKNKYETHIVTDEKKPVTIGRLKTLIERILKDNQVERLLLFYTGHGISSINGDFWLLSGFADDGDEVVNFALSLRHARRHPIAQLAVFADCCRSSIATASLIGGGCLFKTSRSPPDKGVQYDEFFATDAGEVAQEVKGADPAKSYGVFSKCLLDALDGKVPQAVVERPPDRLVSSTSLARWLQEAVPLESGKIPGGVVQKPSLQPGWWTPDDVYLKLAPGPSGPPSDPDDKPRRWGSIKRINQTHDFGILVTNKLQRRVDEALAPRDARRRELSDRFFLDQDRSDRPREIVVAALPHLSVVGARVEGAVCERGVDAEVGGSGVRVANADRPVSVALRLAGGRWAPSLILPRFTGALSVEGGAALNLSYAPFDAPANVIENDARVVADWTAAMIVGQKPGPDELTNVAQGLRYHKHRNPALGILAAYAYDRAGRLDEVRSIAGYFLERDGFVPYDVAALIGFDELAPRMRAAVAGKYPLLALGWTLLEEGRAHPALLELRRGVAGGPWVTLEAPEGKRLADLLQEGSLQEDARQEDVSQEEVDSRTSRKKTGRKNTQSEEEE